MTNLDFIFKRFQLVRRPVLVLTFLLVPLNIINPFVPDFVVAKDGSGEFTLIQDALNAGPSISTKQYIIFIKNGIYNEKIFIEKSNIILAGESRDKTKIVYVKLRKNWREIMLMTMPILPGY